MDLQRCRWAEAGRVSQAQLIFISKRACFDNFCCGEKVISDRPVQVIHVVFLDGWVVSGIICISFSNQIDPPESSVTST
jgi:hypothetical protein